MRKRTKQKRNLDLTKSVSRPRMPLGVFVRMFLIGSVAIGASAYATYRHYFLKRPSMLMAVPPATSAAPGPAASDLLPVPELIPVE